ncbi:hypothetical protein L195_g013500 [Trifolium pratense]|uniref:Uncharacterized protein n=2 Tax=Trifolium pratense TaxID=57577 RepID=A0A2K3PNC0_TRIPR|nr:hypothetical protein L195_g013500 [Trifolium pratense]
MGLRATEWWSLSCELLRFFHLATLHSLTGFGRATATAAYITCLPLRNPSRRVEVLREFLFIVTKLELMGHNEENSSTVKKINSACDVEALKKCLEENKGDYVKCQSQIEAFKSSCSIKKPNSSIDSSPPHKIGV